MTELIATREEGILLLELVDNTFKLETLKSLEMWLNQSKNDHRLFAIILTARGKLFSAGGDLLEMKKELDAGRKSGYVEEIVPLVNKVINLMLTHPLPIIVALNGSVAGGAIGLFLAADHRVAIEKAKVAFAFGGISLTPDSATSFLVPIYFGYNFATSAFSLAKTVPLREYPHIVDKFVENKDQLIEESKKLANQYKNMDRWVYHKTKLLVKRPIIDQLEIQTKLELENIIQACQRQNFEMKLNETINRLSKS